MISSWSIASRSPVGVLLILQRHRQYASPSDSPERHLDLVNTVCDGGGQGGADSEKSATNSTAPNGRPQGEAEGSMVASGSTVGHTKKPQDRKYTWCVYTNRGCTVLTVGRFVCV